MDGPTTLSGRPRTARVFARGAEGSAAVESLLWMVTMLLINALVVDATAVLSGHSQVVRAVHDANRLTSLGRLTSPAETAAHVEARLERLVPNAVATSSVAGGVVTTSVTFPNADLTFLGSLDALNGLVSTISAQHLLDPQVTP